MADEKDKGKKKGGGGFANVLGSLRRRHAGKGSEENDTAAEPNDDAADIGTVDVESGSRREWRSKVRISPEARKKAVRNRWLLMAGGVAALVLVITTVMQHHGAAPGPEAEKAKAGIDLTPPGELRQNFETQTQADIKQMQQQAKDAQAQQEQTVAQLKAMKDQQKKVADSLNQLKQMMGEMANRPVPESGSSLPPPPAPGPALPAPQGQPAAPVAPPIPGPPSASGTAGSASESTGEEAPAPVASNGPIVVTAPAAASSVAPGTTVGANTSWRQNPKAGYIPSGSFVPVVLLTGVEAGTATTSESNPQPVLMRLERRAILPGAARYAVASCFALGSAYGSMSTERAYVRLARISCVDKQHKLVLDSPIKGYLADSDGMFGLRGKLVERRGALLAKTLLSGFISGLGSALGSAQGVATTGAFGAQSAFSGTGALKAAGFQGGSTAANQLAQFYLKQAQAIFPVVEVPPRRKGTLVITEGADLKWTQYGTLYLRQTTPEK